MSDNKNKKGKRDAVKVDSKDTNEVQYVRRKFPMLTLAQVKAAIKRAGPLRKMVYAFIRRKYCL